LRLLCYCVAISLDGFIADEDGGYDWIVMDPEIDFAATMARFDAYVMGRGTFEVTQQPGAGEMLQGSDVYVVSTTLDPSEHPDVTVVSDDVAAFVADLKTRPGKDIWLFGGGILFRTLLEARLVDTVEVGVIPRLLGSGIPMLAGLDGVAALELEDVRAYPTGIVMLDYRVV